MNFDKIPTNEITNIETESKKPEKLYRAFTIDPELISLEKLKETLVPVNVNESDPTKVSDGNELGVYMSTNQHMVETAYASGVAGLSIKCPGYSDGYSKIDYVRLPSCGIVLEIDTTNLEIREPEISAPLQGVYNNGFGGEEWIADKIPAQHYKAIKFILSRHAHDKQKIVVEVTDNNIEEALNTVKREYEKKKEEALRFKKFLDELLENERMSKMIWERKWESCAKNIENLK